MQSTNIVCYYITIIILFTSCVKKPDFSKIPEIEFLSIERIGVLDTKSVRVPTVVDTVKITIKFKDGNGDLGLNRSDTLPPYAQFNKEGELNRFRNNYFWTVLRKENGQFIPYELPDPETVPQRFPYLNEESTKGGPLQGTLTFTEFINPLIYEQFRFSTNPIRKFDTLKFRVQILDRELNESNIVETSEIVVNQNE